ncbi:MAG: DNA polymerase I [Patescibacteria group bacterium]|nr:DNA polymerase I [Patescibacteria group bacterium]
MKEQKKKTLLILDGNALLHRAWHALPPLTDPKGRIVNAVYGFISVLLKMIKEQAPEYMAVTFDKAGPTFRHEEFKEYKATRVKQPDELYAQIPMVKDILRVFNIPVFEAAGYEADDVIGTLSRILDPRMDVDSVIVTGDMDTLQLVDRNTRVLAFVKGLSQATLYGESEVRERYGLPPDHLIDYKAIAGDASDNIPGVPGIGPKGAGDLIREFDSLENVYHEVKVHPEKFKKGTLEKLQKGEKMAKLSQKLSKIIIDVPIKFALEKCELGKWNRDEMVAALGEFGFKSLIAKLPGAESENKGTMEQGNNRTSGRVGSIREMEKALAGIAREKQIAVAAEIGAAGLFGASLAGLAVYFPESGAQFFDLARLSKTDLKKFVDLAAPVLENENIKKIGHDLKREAALLAGQGIRLAGFDFDVMIAAYLLSSGTRSYDLESVILQEFGEEMKIGTADSAANKIKRIWDLRDALEPRLSEAGMAKLFQEIEMPLVPVLAAMEQIGVKIDSGFLNKMAVKVDESIEKLSKKIYKMAGGEFNINSPTQLKEVLFEKLAISPAGIRRGKTGLSTAAPELEKMRGQHEIIDLIFEHRELAKLKSTYIDALPRLVDNASGRVHTSFNQTVTSTGRLSSSNPNLQNIPIRSELGREIRKAFIAEPKNLLVAADYSQIELRIVSALAGDERMIQAFREKRDIHTATAAAIWGVPEDKVDKDMRRSAKAINFGIIYGQGPRGLAQSAGISYAQAEEFIRKYFEVYSGVAEYMERTRALAREFGYVETIFGRRRYLPEINSHVAQLQAAAERMAINMPVQGAAADIMKIAMIKIHAGLSKISPKSKMILQVHDELVFEVPETEAKKVAAFAQEEMESAAKLAVPIVVEVESGKNWGSMDKII